MVTPSVRKSVPKPVEKFRGSAEWFNIIILKSDRWERRLVAIILNHATTSGCLFLLESGQIPFVSSPSVHQWLYQYFPGLSILGFHVTSQHMQIRRPPCWCRRSILAYVKMQCFGAWFFTIYMSRWCRRSILAYVKMQCFGAWFFAICRVIWTKFLETSKGKKKGRYLQYNFKRLCKKTKVTC